MPNQTRRGADGSRGAAALAGRARSVDGGEVGHGGAPLPSPLLQRGRGRTLARIAIGLENDERRNGSRRNLLPAGNTTAELASRSGIARHALSTANAGASASK